MSKRCSVCSHPSVEDINRALASGTQQLQLGRKYGLSKYALCRHAKTHLPAAVAKAQEAAEVAQGDDLLGLILEQRDTARRIVGDAEGGGQKRVALSGVRELLRVADLLAKIGGQINTGTTVNNNIVLSPEWVRVQTLVLNTLQPYPEARVAVADALLQLQEPEP